MKKHIIAAVPIISFGAMAADVYYSDGGYVTVPDSWVEIVPKGDCEASQEVAAEEWLNFRGVSTGAARTLRQQDVLREAWINSGSE